MSSQPKTGLRPFDESKVKAQPCAVGAGASSTTATATEGQVTHHDHTKDQETIEVDPGHERLNASEEHRLKKDQYNFQQSSHTAIPNPKNEHRAGGNGRDHGQYQLQNRSQNH